MPFYQHAFFPAAADQTFSNIFQLINDIDSYQREASAAPVSKPQPQQKPQQQKPQQQKPQQKLQQKPQQKPQQRICKPQPQPQLQHRRGLNSLFGLSRPFSPRFDVRETDSSYELHGELAGVDRKDISLEFTEPQTLVVSGSVERNYSSASPAVAAPEAVPEAIADTHSESDDEQGQSDGARTPVGEDEPFTEITAPRSPSPARSHRATVTDEATEEALERGEDITNTEKAPSTEVEVADPAVVTPEETEPAAPKERYWVQERAVGQFKRVFNFPVPVDEANVRASLENGILNVSVPKAKRQPRRIVVF